MPYQVIKELEKRIAEYAGAPYAVAVDSCTNAIFLSLKYAMKMSYGSGEVHLPKHTYPGVACAVINAGGKIIWTEKEWEGVYELFPYGVWDGALRFKRDMYKGGYHCLSFHGKKHLNIGRGGMILTDDPKAVKWFRRARFDGRNEVALMQDDFQQLGYNMYLTPELASRGLVLFDFIKDLDLADIDDVYPDLSNFEVYKGAE